MSRLMYDPIIYIAYPQFIFPEMKMLSLVEYTKNKRVVVPGYELPEYILRDDIPDTVPPQFGLANHLGCNEGAFFMSKEASRSQNISQRQVVQAALTHWSLDISDGTLMFFLYCATGINPLCLTDGLAEDLVRFDGSQKDNRFRFYFISSESDAEFVSGYMRLHTCNHICVRLGLRSIDDIMVHNI